VPFLGGPGNAASFSVRPKPSLDLESVTPRNRLHVANWPLPNSTRTTPDKAEYRVVTYFFRRSQAAKIAVTCLLTPRGTRPATDCPVASFSSSAAIRSLRFCLCCLDATMHRFGTTRLGDCLNCVAVRSRDARPRYCWPVAHSQRIVALLSSDRLWHQGTDDRVRVVERCRWPRSADEFLRNRQPPRKPCRGDRCPCHVLTYSY
jgi:hypothetical protein